MFKIDLCGDKGMIFEQEDWDKMNDIHMKLHRRLEDLEDKLQNAPESVSMGPRNDSEEE